MAEEVAGRMSEPAKMPISAIFALEGLVSEEHRTAVISRVLAEFSTLPREAQQALRARRSTMRLCLPVGDSERDRLDGL